MAKPYKRLHWCSCCYKLAVSRKQAMEWYKLMERFLDFAGRGRYQHGWLCGGCSYAIAGIAVVTFDGMRDRVIERRSLEGA